MQINRQVNEPLTVEHSFQVYHASSPSPQRPRSHHTRTHREHLDFRRGTTASLAFHSSPAILKSRARTRRATSWVRAWQARARHAGTRSELWPIHTTRKQIHCRPSVFQGILDRGNCDSKDKGSGARSQKGHICLSLGHSRSIHISTHRP